MVECWLCLRVEGGKGGELADFATWLVEWKGSDRSSPSSGMIAEKNMPRWYHVAHTRKEEQQLLWRIDGAIKLVKTQENEKQ